MGTTAPAPFRSYSLPLPWDAALGEGSVLADFRSDFPTLLGLTPWARDLTW